MDDPRSNQYEEPIDTETAEIVDRPDLESTDRELRGRGYSIEAGEKEDSAESSDSSEEEVDEHRLLSASFHAAKTGVRGGRGGKSTGHGESESGRRNPAASTTSINLSDSWNDEDLDPFSYGPPLTRWDYFKVSLV